MSYNDSKILGSISWIGYIKQFFRSIIQSCIGAAIITVILGLFSSIFFPLKPYENAIIYTGVVFYSLLLIYNLLYLRSIKLYQDERGIWFYSGILPWNKGYNGIKWDDIDQINYKTGFMSWLFKSYTIIISHKYTKSSEIILPDIYKGHVIVANLNQQ